MKTIHNRTCVSIHKFSRHRVYTDFSNPVVKHDIQDKKKKERKKESKK